MPQKKEATTRYTDKNGPQFLRKILAAAALPRAVLRCRSFFKSLFSKGEDRPLPQRTLLAAAICLPLAAICLSTVTENAFFILGEERGRGMDKAYAALRCRLSAGLGDVEAQVRLAKLYAEGHGLPRDEEKSLFWYGEAAGQGHAEAQRYLAFEAYSLTWAEMARWRQKLTDQGDVRAKYLLGDMYAKGIGVPQDKAKALYWFRSAADQEYDSAQFMLGDMYAASDGVPQDKVLAAEWFRKAAEQGHGEARFRLGGMYAKGDGVPQDKAEAACWYRKAALRGHDEAAFELGSMYAAGDGVPQDKAEAACWYRKAAEQKNVRAQWRLGNMYASGEGLSKDTEKALDWCVTAVERGAVLGPAYFDVRRVEKEAAEAAGWLRKAAEWNNRAQWQLGVMYAAGDGVPQDTKTALDWLRSAVEHGIGYEGLVYFSAQGEPKDKSRAINWLREFVKTRDRDDTRLYSDILYSGNSDMAQNMAEAAGWLRKTAEQGFVEAQYILGRMYADASEPPDTAEAIRWYRMAAEQGHHDAQVELRILLRSEGKLP